MTKLCASPCGDWLSDAERLPSPNANQRPAGTVIDLLVIHNISLPPGEFGGQWVEKFFTNQLPADAHPYFATIAELKVSAHCYIKRSGQVVQFVPLSARAWHAGRSQFQGRDECNDYAIGIELEGADHVPYTDAQYQQLARVTREIMAAYPAITPDRMTGHSNIAPGRKTDPGPAFDWDRFRQEIQG